MAWKHPAFLWVLPALGVVVLLYLRAFRRVPAQGVVSFPLWLVAEAAARGSRVRRHLPAGILLLAVAAIVVGAAGPIIPWSTPTGWPVVLIIDVSRSMEETDIPPTRIEAAKTAALDFVGGLPRSTRVALVSFGNYATVVVPLTSDRGRLRDGIRGLSTQLRTQLGTGLVEGVHAVTGEQGTTSQPDRPTAVAVLLSDGRASDGIPPLEAAQEARRRGVRVYTVGMGTTTDPSKLRSGYWGVLDEPTLRAIAAETGGEYFHAAATEKLRRVYRDLARAVGWEMRPLEMTAIVAGIAITLLVASVLLRHAIFPIH